MTPEETAANEKTREHAAEVSRLIHDLVKALLDRADEHDKSKMQEPELSHFARMTLHDDEDEGP